MKAKTISASPNPAMSAWLASIAPAADRMKKIATESGDALYLCDGPVQPDHALLDLCGDALHYAKAAEQAYEMKPGFSVTTVRSAQETEAWREQHDRAMKEYYFNTNEVTQRLRKAKKMKATTPAGIYAKALLVRVSKTGATELAMSLANDFLDCPGLRESLWPAGGAD